MHLEDWQKIEEENKRIIRKIRKMYIIKGAVGKKEETENTRKERLFTEVKQR